MKKIEFPNKKSLDSIFSSISKEKPDHEAFFPFVECIDNTNQSIPIGPYVGTSIRDDSDRKLDHFYAVPNDEIVDFIRNSMIAAGVNDRITFEIIDNVDSLLLVARNSVIIGSRWLARLDPSEKEKIRSITS